MASGNGPGYVIAPADKIWGDGAFSAFDAAKRDMEAALLARAQAKWGGESILGGLFPTGNQLGIGPMRKNDMAGDSTNATPSGSYTFNITIATANAWRDVFNYRVPEDQLHGFLGFAVPNDTLLLQQIRWEIGDQRFPLFDLQEAQLFSKFAIVFKVDKGKELVADPDTRVLVRAYVEGTGTQRVVPLGLIIYKVKDHFITET